MELPKLDTERLDRVVNWASFSENWNQATWATLYGAHETELWDLYNADEIRNDSLRDRIGTAFDNRTAELEKDPECGSSYCIAGQTVHEAGYRMLFDTEMGASSCILQVPTHAVDDKGQQVWVDHPQAEPESIPEVASTLLGITKTEAALLFDGENGLEQVMGFANLFHARRGLPEPYQDQEGLSNEQTQEAEYLLGLEAKNQFEGSTVDAVAAHRAMTRALNGDAIFGVIVVGASCTP